MGERSEPVLVVNSKHVEMQASNGHVRVTITMPYEISSDFKRRSIVINTDFDTARRMVEYGVRLTMSLLDGGSDD